MVLLNNWNCGSIIPMNSASPLSSSLSLSLSLFVYLDLTILVAISKILASDLACILDSDLDFNYVEA